jgi:hypothetical protein
MVNKALQVSSVDRPAWFRLVSDACVLLVVALFAAIEIRAPVFFHVQEPLFRANADFVWGELSQPGGAAQLTAGLLGQLMVDPIAGALAWVVLAGLLLAMSDWALKLLAGRRLPAARYVLPAVLMSTAWTYKLELSLATGMVILLGGAVAYMALPIRRLWARAAALAVLTAGVYFLAATDVKVALLLMMASFAALCVGHDAARRRSLAGGLAWAAVLVAVVAAVFVLAEWATQPDWLNTWRRPMGWWMPRLSWPMSWAVIGMLAMATTPLVLAGLVALAALVRRAVGALSGGSQALSRPASSSGRSRVKAKGRTKGHTEPRPLSQLKMEDRLRWLLGTIVAVALVLGTMLLPRVVPEPVGVPAWRARAVRIAYYARMADWQAVVDEANAFPFENWTPDITWDVNLALSEQGRLNDELLSWPAARQPLPRFHDVPDHAYMRRLVDFCIRLGRINDAEHFAYERLTLDGRRASSLRDLAEIHMIKGESEMARVYLRNLADDLVYRPWARRLLPQAGQNDPRVLELRKLAMPQDDVAETLLFTDDLIPVFLVHRQLESLLQHNPSNRLACDMLIAYCLYNGRSDLVVAQVPRLKACGYERLPVHVQEAALSQMELTGEDVELDGYEISPEQRQRFSEFKAILARSGGDMKVARVRLGDAGLWDTYWFHKMFTLEGRNRP